MNPRPQSSRHWRLLALLGANAWCFVAAWVLAIWCDRRDWINGMTLSVAAGLSLGQFLVLAFNLTLNARPAPRHWLFALAGITAASVGFCSLELLLQQRWLESRWINPAFAIINQLAYMLSLIAVGVLLLILTRLLTWPCRRLFGWRIVWADQQAESETRQFSLAEIFLITAAVALSCTLGRALFEATLMLPLIYGAVLLVGALPTAVAAFLIASGRGRWRDFGAVFLWAGLAAVGMTPFVAELHNTLGLLDQWLGRWTILDSWSPSAFAAAASFSLAVALATSLNWLALARLGLRCRVEPRKAPQPAAEVAAIARLTPPAAPR